MRLTRRQVIGAAALWSPLRRAWASEAPGKIERWPDFRSRHVGPRNVEIWLPPGYSAERRHAVLYFHDGQMAFDATRTWNGQSWDLDDTLAVLIAAREVQSTIVVAIWNAGKARHAEFFPQGFLPWIEPESWRRDFVEKALQGHPRSDAYLAFIVEELKPAIDAQYATLPDRDHTFMMGSSMGGLISLYAQCEYPQIFGGVAALSTHWIGIFEKNRQIPAAALRYLEQHLPPAESVRLYLDRGTTELDALYDDAQRDVDKLLQDRGYRPPGTVSRIFDGDGHSERAWKSRVAIPLRHLLV